MAMENRRRYRFNHRDTETQRFFGLLESFKMIFECTYVRCVANFGFWRGLNLFCNEVVEREKTNCMGAFWRFLLHNVHTYINRGVGWAEIGRKWAFLCKKACFLVNVCTLCTLYKSEMIVFAFGLLKLSRRDVHWKGQKSATYTTYIKEWRKWTIS